MLKPVELRPVTASLNVAVTENKPVCVPLGVAIVTVGAMVSIGVGTI